MQKKIEILFKSKFFYERAFNQILAKVTKENEEELIKGTVEIDWTDWTDKDKAIITIKMSGTEEEINALTRSTMREKIAMRSFSPFLTIKVKDD